MSGTVDASIALNANRPQPINPLAQLGQYVQASQGMQNLQRGNIDIARQNALAQAYQNAPIDPRTGLADPNALMKSLQNSPYGGLSIPDVINANQAQAANAYKLADANRAAFGSVVAPLLALGNGVKPSDVFGAMKRLQASGAPGVDKMVDQAEATMPTVDQTKAGDPKYQAAYGQALHNWVAQTWGAQLPAQTQAGVFTPQVSAIDNGPNINLVNTQPMAGPVASYGNLPKGFAPTIVDTGKNLQPVLNGAPVGLGIQKTITPGDAAGMVAVPTPNGTVYMTHAQAIQFANKGALSGSFGTPAAPNQGANAQPGTPVAPPGITPAPGGGFQAGVGIQEGEDLKNTADASDQQYNDMHASMNGYASRMFTLQKALTGLQNAPTGPGSDTVNELKSFLLAQSPVDLKSFGVYPSKISNFDEAKKYLTQYALGQAAQFGHGTDQQLATTLTGNASTHISNLAAQDVVKASIALERMRAAQIQAFDQSGEPPSAFNKWSVGWQKTVDPRLFEFDMLSPEQRTKLVQSIGKPGSPAYKEFAQKLYAAQQSGFLKPPQAANAQP